LEEQPKSTFRYKAIYNEIRDRICLLQYPPGMMLSENQLASEFGVSRTPIRRVLQRLEFEGLVVSKQGIGTLVTIVDLQYLKEVYALRLKLSELAGEL
jgi:DNA-binding GntR family transcriptional regulator